MNDMNNVSDENEMMIDQDVMIDTNDEWMNEWMNDMNNMWLKWIDDWHDVKRMNDVKNLTWKMLSMILCDEKFDVMKMKDVMTDDINDVKMKDVMK